MAARIQIDTVRTDAAEMEYFRFGQGGETLVILPGLSVRSVMHWADAVAEAYRSLTDDFTIYVFDRRKELPPGYSVLEMAEDTAAAFRALGLRETCLFGASQGGMIALAMAIRQPSAVFGRFSNSMVISRTAGSAIPRYRPNAASRTARGISPRLIFQNIRLYSSGGFR